MIREAPTFALLLFAAAAGALSCGVAPCGSDGDREDPGAVRTGAVPEPPTRDRGRPARSHDAGGGDAGGEAIRSPAEEIPDDMIGVPGGAFSMGLDDRGIPDERPAHTVVVDPFLLDRTEVTNAAYLACVDAGVCRRHARVASEKAGYGPDGPFRTPSRPVSGVSHEDARTYCEWAKKRLPTEAEWERAARGSDGRLFPWGDDLPTAKRAVFRARITEPVGSRPLGAGPYGHLDLAGNVWEWVADRYDPHAYRRDTASRGVPGSCREIMAALSEIRRKGLDGFTGTNPIPTECERVLRGGAFNYFPWGLRSTNRVHHPGRFRIVMAGFRCARDRPGGPVEGNNLENQHSR